MSEKRIRLIYGIILSVALVAAAVCLMAACLNIYHSGGEQTYTPEKVAKAFAPIALVVYLAIALTLGGFLLHFILPGDKLRIKLGKNEALILKKLHQKQDYKRCGDAKIRGAIEREQNRRRTVTFAGLSLLAVGSAVFLVYALNYGRYDGEDITAIMVNAMWVLLPCMAVPFGFGVWSVAWTKASIRREISLMKLVAAPREKTEPVPAAAGRFSTVQVARLVLLGVAVVFIVGGFLFDGWKDVLTKAVNICTECVGLG